MMCKDRVGFLLVGIFLMFTSVVCVAAEDEAIKKIVQQLNAVTLISGQFEQQKQLQGLDYPLSSSGHFIFWKDKGLYLASDKPFFNATTITLNQIIHWREDGSGSLSQEQSGLIQREISRTLLAFFSADLTLIEERFNTQWQFDETGWQLLLTPRHEMVRKQMHSAQLRGADYIESLRLTGGNGDITLLTFTNITDRAAPTAEQCRWFFLDNPQQYCAMP